jgi:site-specific DNA-methyltransferase (adenine-specific)
MPQSIALNIDCMEYMKDIPDKYFSLAIVDPPYGIGRFWEGGDGKNFGYRKGMQENPDWNERGPDKFYFEELLRVSKNQIVWGWNYYTDYLGSTDSLIIWDKRMGAPNYSAAEIAYTSFGHKIKIYVESRNSSRDGLAIHPCQKSIKMYDWQLVTYAKPGDNILDTHLGSGSSRIACHKAGFDFVGCEIDKDYFDAQEKRFNDYLKQIPIDFKDSSRESSG